MMTVEHLNFSYRCGRQILHDVSFAARSGECLAILGNNGAGKSTLLKCFSHILRPQSGSVRVDGAELLAMSHGEMARNVAFVAQNPPASRLTVYDMILLGRRPYMKWGVSAEDYRLVDEMLSALGLEDMAVRPMDRLSGGEQQKIMLARALVQQPRVLLLDEPTSSLDLHNQYEVLSLVQKLCRERNIAAVMVIHDLNLALRYCDRFLLLHNGGVHAFGDASVVSEENIRDVYNVNARVCRVDGIPVVVPVC